jgi:nucleoside-diphosphate-sugar epimerase
VSGCAGGGKSEPGSAIAFSAGRGHLQDRIVVDILITGATGFVGSHLVEALGRRGLKARALVRTTSDVSILKRFGVERVVGDLGDTDALRRAVADVDTVVHLAAATRALRPATFHEVNGAGTLRLLEAMEADGGGRRMVYLSSLAAVGPAGGRPVRPEDEPRPLTTYGRSKLEGERHALGRDATAVAVLRPPAVYGPRDRELLPFFRFARYGLLPVIGSVDRRLQMVHVRDLAEALVRAAEAREATGIFHIAEPTAYTWGEMLDHMARAVGRRGVKVRVPAAVLKAAAGGTQVAARMSRRPAVFDGEKALELLAAGWTCETDGAREALGFETSIPLADGLRETASWYRAHGWM